MRLARGSFLLVVFVLLFHLSMQHGVNHDEHQFVASGALLTRNGLLPYLDYAYFHAPYLVFIYAALFSFSPYLSPSLLLPTSVSFPPTDLFS